MESIWTPKLIKNLRMLWDEGHSTAEIGRRLGVSKNAAVGKAHRLNLRPRMSPLKCPPKYKSQRFIANRGNGTCSWPVGHPGDKDFGFCDKHTIAGKPYCPEHDAIAYVRPKRHDEVTP